jgi:PAS domain S-box-containing protein
MAAGLTAADRAGRGSIKRMSDDPETFRWRLRRAADWPLRTKVAALLVAASLLPLGIAAWIDIHQTRQRLLESANALLQARGEQLVLELDEFHRGFQAAARRLALAPEAEAFCTADEAARASLQPRAQRLLASFPDTDARIGGVTLLDHTGRVLLATDPTLTGADRSFRPHVRAALQGHVATSDIYLASSARGEQPVVGYSAPLLVDGQVRCAVVLAVQASALWQRMRAANGLAGPGSYAVLFDRLGIRIGHTYSDDIVFRPGGPLDAATIDRLVAEQRFGTRTRALLQDVRVFAQQFDMARADAAPSAAVFRGFAPVNQAWNFGVARRFETVPWTLFYMVPEAGVFGRIAAATQGKALLALAMMALAMGAGWLLSAGMVRRIQGLRGAAAAVATGDLTARVHATARDELGQLARSFNAMATSLQQQSALVARRTAELEAANAALAQRADAIAELYDQAPCGYLTLAPRGTVLQANETLLALLGVARDAFVGHDLIEFVVAHDRPQAAALARGEHQGRDLELDFVCKDGNALPVSLSAAVVRDAAGAVAQVRATLLDNSERKERERRIAEMQRELARRADQAEAATRAKSAFLANMSHEIRTPMNAIIGFTHLMARDSADERQRDRLAKVDEAARHLLQIINDILDLSKIEAGKLMLEDIEFTLESVLSSALDMVRERAAAKQLELVLDTNHLPDRLRGDPTRLAQALINLLTNAVKFTRHGWVRVRGELLSQDEHGLLARFEVRDTGEGIDPQRLARLFTAFEQADASITRRHGGTGLGLALTRHIATLMGGEIGVHSEPGSGSTFWFTARLGRANPARPPAAPVALRGRRALVVDDLPETLEVLAERLRDYGLEVSTADGGETAVQRLQSALAAAQPFDVAFIDWRMAPLDGLQTLQRLRGVAGAAMAPAILVSAYDEPRLREQALDTGFAAVLVKPITPSALHDALVRVLHAHAPARAPAAQGGEALAQLRRRHTGARVLLAEDNPINQEVAATLLTAAGLQVELADNGEDAVEMALTRSFDLILMDMQMPRMDGLVAATTIRAKLGPALPIIAMTANAFAEDRAACLAAGMDDHLPKPVVADALYGKLLAWLPRADADADAKAP